MDVSLGMSSFTGLFFPLLVNCLSTFNFPFPSSNSSHDIVSQASGMDTKKPGFARGAKVQESKVQIPRIYLPSQLLLNVYQNAAWLTAMQG